ncbi:hypothetical protein GC163_23605 [bacterium]|nr:hypothetical protein [bacterium]
MSQTPRMPVSVVLFTLAYLLPAVGAAVILGNGEFIFYSVVMVILCGVVIAVHHNSDLPRPVLWGLSLWGLAHMVGGLVPIPETWPHNGPNAVVYSWWLIPNLLKYDQVVHAFGFGVTTWVCWQGLCAITNSLATSRAIEPTFGALLLCMAAACGFGALNEVIEFMATLLIPSTNVGGYVNTGWDLVSNLVGAMVAALSIRATRPRSRP